MVRKEGKGGLRHRAIQKFLADYFRKQGKVAVIEAYIGKNVDILVSDTDKTIAIEIQLSSKHCLQIKRDYELGCDEVWVVCESNEILNSIRKQLKNKLSKTLFDKTKFHILEDFIPHKVIKTIE